VATKDHYVSRFFLSNFVDPVSGAAKEPWVWVGDIASGTVKRRSPKNLGWSRNLFQGPGGLVDRSRRLEEHLAKEVERPAALALRQFLALPLGHVKEIPPGLARYLAWLAARSLTMKALYESWISEMGPVENAHLVEPPPPGIGSCANAPDRRHTMEHFDFGIREDVRGDQIEDLRLAGWRWHLSNDDFLEMVHIQAWYFQVRFFPRLSWKILDAPDGSCFLTCDRPAVWGVDGQWEVPPSALRDRRAELIIPVARTRALFGFNPKHDRLGPIRSDAVNQVIGNAAHAWIAGPSKDVVNRALHERRFSAKGKM